MATDSSPHYAAPPPLQRAYDMSPRVTIVLALYDGLSHLEAQLQSYVDQTLHPIHVLASDDHPGDGTGAAFEAFAARAPAECHWQLIAGPQQGLTVNFLHLLATVDADATDYVALSDQDDIWLPEKLESAVVLINAATSEGAEQPILLGSRSWEWQDSTDIRRLSRPIPGPLDFTHALAQNFAGGNTMVLNRAALKLVQAALPNLPEPALHDWWLYQLISGAGGRVMLDPEPRLLYRQHGRNQVGANMGLRSKISRLHRMISGTYRGWMDQNLAALQAHPDLLTPEARALTEGLAQARKAPLRKRLSFLRHSRLHRKGRANQAALWVATALRRL